MRIDNFLSIVGETYLIEKTEKLKLLTVFNPSSDSNLSSIGEGKKVILEGVETSEDLMFAKQLNVDFIQGFYYRQQFKNVS